jgi:glycosyltransferase involved in cell wall biosynthesis
MRVGLISSSGQARNAIGNQLAEKLGFFVDRGADVRIFLQSAQRLHPALRRHVQVIDKVQTSGPVWEFLAGADLVIADLAEAYDLLHFLPLLAGGKPRLLVDYHGITPAHLWSGWRRADLEEGLGRRGLAWCADYALVHSGFMHGDLVGATGFPADRVFQLDFPLHERFHPGSGFLRAQLGLGSAALLLYVGRVAPNKRIPVLIEAVARLRNVQPEVHAVILGDDADIYSEEKRRCRGLADRLGVGTRVHFLGAVEDEGLADAYRDADVLVMPSVHEGFCLPVMEAMASGLPVIAARATALPETVGDAGLTFTPDDADDLARQVRRVLRGSCGEATDRPAAYPTGRVAIVSFRFGTEIVGGAETSLRKIAHVLRRHGKEVETFTTCTRAESAWSDDLPPGSTCHDGLQVHRFPIDPHDRNRHLDSVRQVLEGEGHVGPDVEATYLEHSIRSRQLLAKLAERIDEFDAVIVGPYLFGLTWEVARTFPDKTLLLACFHQEPLAHLQCWPATYGQVGGILYHSSEERALAQTELGVNHPNSVEIGTVLELQPAASTRTVPFAAKRYLVYCGRYSRQKEVPRLLEYVGRYQADKPGRFGLAFMGQGEIAVPESHGVRDLGRVDDSTKRAVLAGAAALVQLSRQESLSLVALEAWAEGTPVLADGRCAVLAGQVRRSQGGAIIENFADFAKALDDLWERPEAWKQRGLRGQAYVRERYSSEEVFAGKLLAAVEGLQVPLREHLRRRGLARAQFSTRTCWRERFGKWLEQMLDAEPRALRSAITVQPLHVRTNVKTGTRTLLVPVRIENRGTHAVTADGPARSVLFCEVAGGAGVGMTPLPGMLLPGKSVPMAATATVPARAGEYPMRLWVAPEPGNPDSAEVAESMLIVGATGAGGCSAPFRDAALEALGKVQERQRLPDDYLDVCEGPFARWKRWIKGKLLGNFKRGYVDVLSRQQSQVNQQVLTALHQLTECCATLDHALCGLQDRLDRLEERFRSDDKLPHSTSL